MFRWSSNWILGDGWWRPRHWACTTGCTSTAKYSAWASRGSNDPPIFFTCLHMSSLLNTLIFRAFPLLRLFSREHSSTSWAIYRLQPMKNASLTNCWSYTLDCSLLGGWTTRPRKHVESNECGPTPLRLTKGSQLQMETGVSDSSGECSPDWPEVLVPFQHPKLSQLWEQQIQSMNIWSSALKNPADGNRNSWTSQSEWSAMGPPLPCQEPSSASGWRPLDPWKRSWRWLVGYGWSNSKHQSEVVMEKVKPENDPPNRRNLQQIF